MLHAPGVEGTITVESDAPAPATLDWDQVDPADQAQLDRVEIIEHAAEAVSLALVSVARGWTVMSRLQRWEYGDWLLVSPTGERVALEVSGIEGSFDRRRLRVKLDQVRRGTNPSARFASVVAFARPEVQLARA